MDTPCEDRKRERHPTEGIDDLDGRFCGLPRQPAIQRASALWSPTHALDQERKEAVRAGGRGDQPGAVMLIVVGRREPVTG